MKIFFVCYVIYLLIFNLITIRFLFATFISKSFTYTQVYLCIYFGFNVIKIVKKYYA